MKDLIVRSIAPAIRILLRLSLAISRVLHHDLNLITTSVSARRALARRDAFKEASSDVGLVNSSIDRTGQLPRSFGTRKDGGSTSWIFKLLKVWSLENAHHLLLGFKKYFCLKSFFNKILTLSPLKWPHPVEGGGGKGCNKRCDHWSSNWCLYLADDP